MSRRRQNGCEAATLPKTVTLDPATWTLVDLALRLTPKQSDIARLVLLGYSDSQIAKELDRAIPTVRTHLGHIYRKLDIVDRTQLVLCIFATVQETTSKHLPENRSSPCHCQQ